MKQGRVEVFKGKDGWRWRFRAANSRIVACSGEGFTRKSSANRAFDAAFLGIAKDLGWKRV